MPRHLGAVAGCGAVELVVGGVGVCFDVVPAPGGEGVACGGDVEGAGVEAEAGAEPEPESEREAELLAPVAPPTLWDRLGLRLSGYLQAQYTHNQLSEDSIGADGLPMNQDRFFVRRGRLRLDRTWDYASLAFEIDASNTRSPSDQSVMTMSEKGSSFTAGRGR